ncbi:response regulator [Flexithrix dorotheae]|uniref:response regulator n=1 Tax=Flexithrix dorotheae TaxID=70993 RepID=UPI000365FE49|nr:response regulator transcription factor [Flexithrix dorotheae]
MIKIFIADDHQIFVESLIKLLETEESFKVIGAANDGKSLLAKISFDQPDVILMDISMPGMDGIAATKLVKEKYPHTEIIMLTMHNDKKHLDLVTDAGAKGYLIKNIKKEILIKAVHEVSAGRAYYCDEVIDGLTNGNGEIPTPKIKEEVILTSREKEVLSLILKEYTAREIADKLFIAQSTVETHRKNLIHKTGVRNTLGLVKYGVEHGF